LLRSNRNWAKKDKNLISFDLFQSNIYAHFIIHDISFPLCCSYLEIKLHVNPEINFDSLLFVWIFIPYIELNISYKKSNKKIFSLRFLKQHAAWMCSLNFKSIYLQYRVNKNTKVSSRHILPIYRFFLCLLSHLYSVGRKIKFKKSFHSVPFFHKVIVCLRKLKTRLKSNIICG